MIGCNINALKNDLGVVFLLQVLNQSDFSLSHPGIGQLKNIFAYYYSPFNLRNSGNNSATQLLQMEFLLALKSQLEDKLDKWQEGKNFNIVRNIRIFLFPRVCRIWILFCLISLDGDITVAGLNFNHVEIRIFHFILSYYFNQLTWRP